MLQLDSNIYKNINVHTKDEIITMPAANGVRLMEHLTSDNASSHVMITDIYGVKMVMNKNDIRKIIPVTKPPHMKSQNTTDINKNRRNQSGEGFEKFMAKRKEIFG